MDHTPDDRQTADGLAGRHMGMAPAALTDAAHARSPQVSHPPGREALRIPDPQFPNKAPADHRSSCSVFPSAPGGQPDSIPQAGARSAELRGAGCSDEQRVQALPDVPGGGFAVPAVRASVVAAAADLHLQRTNLPVRSPGKHMHPALHRPPLAGGSGQAGNSR